MSQRIAIVNDGSAWFVRSIRLIERDVDFDEKVYRCDQPISGPHKTLADVPQVAAANADMAARLLRLQELRSLIVTSLKGSLRLDEASEVAALLTEPTK